MAANFPGAAPALKTDYLDNVDDVMAANQNQPNLETNAIAAKLGTGASTPTNGKILKGNGVGTSAWADPDTLATLGGQPLDADLTALAALTSPAEKLDLAPTDLKISTASKGGVFKAIDSAAGDTPVTASGWVEDEKYGIYFNEYISSASAEFDSAVKRTGKFTVKLSLLDATGKGRIGIGIPTAAAASTADNSKNLVDVKPSTKYRFSCYVKTYNVAANGVQIQIDEYPATFGARVAVTASSKLTGTNDWTLLTLEITTKANTGKLQLQGVMDVAGNVSDAWFDVNSMTLEEIVTDTTFTGKIAEKIRPVLQAVTSTDNIDQSQLTYGSTRAFGSAIRNKLAQQFIPTKKYLSKVVCQRQGNNGTYVGNVTVSIQSDSGSDEPTGTILASKTIANATWNAYGVGADIEIDVPCLLTAGTKYWIVFDSSTYDADNNTILRTSATNLYTNGLLKGYAPSTWTTITEDLVFKTLYAKKTETFSLIVNGIKTELKADKDGLLSNSIIDLDNGKYQYDSGLFAGVMSANALAFANNVFSATAGGRLNIGSIINDWYASGAIINAKNDAVDRYIILKINTILPIKHLKLTSKYGCFAGGTATYEISADNVTYTTIHTQTVSSANNPAAVVIETDLMNGLNTFYIKLHKASSVSDYFEVGRQIIEANLDTSKIPQGLLYPLATNQFTETLKLPSSATRVYFRLNKFTNENGVVMPALEFTDASAVNIGYVSLKLDNSQETNPSVAIVKASTTNGQASGTGSDEGANYILNDGEYMTLSTAVAELSVVYLVGKGTTAFTNITKNTLYLSSNGDSSDSTQDPSHQMNVIVGARQQGLTDRVKDIGNQVEDVRKGIPKIKTIDITVLASATTGTAEVPRDSIIIGCVPISNQDQFVDSVLISGTTITVTLAAAATADNKFRITYL